MNKKTTFSILAFVVSMLMPLVLTSCGEDIQVPDNPENEAIENPIDGAATLFTGSKTALDDADGTRTSMNAKRKFFWEPGDVIWLDEAKDGQFSTKLTESKLSADKASANFYLRGKILTDNKYDILYTGNDTTTTSPFSVTIAKEQRQTKWNNAEHFGESGDCGVAEATPNGSGKYNFVVKHKAAYLMLAPYLNSAITESCELTKIEIISNNTIAGEYPFNKTDGLVTNSTITNPSDTIRLHCTPKANSGDAFTITPTSSDTCFVVLQPGTHTLTIKYTIKSLTQNGRTFTFVMDAFTKNFKVNGVTTIRHELIPMTFRGGYYRWASNNPWPTVKETVTGVVTPPTQLTYGDWTDLPNVNQMYWYIKNGDPRWDAQTPWIFTNVSYYTGSAWVERKFNLTTGGAWYKKKAVIQANAGGTMTRCGGASHGGNGPTFCDAHGVRNQDMRADVLFPDSDWDLIIDNSTHYRTAGKPSDVTDYFFLPALGRWDNQDNQFKNLGTGGVYWSRSPSHGLIMTDPAGNPYNPPVDDRIYSAWSFRVNAGYTCVWYSSKAHGLVARAWWFK